MELIKVTNDGALHFKLSDGRIGASYPSGYVRVSVHGINNKLYQINKLLLKESNKHGYYYERELLPLQRDRLNHLINFNNKNCRSWSTKKINTKLIRDTSDNIIEYGHFMHNSLEY